MPSLGGLGVRYYMKINSFLDSLIQQVKKDSFPIIVPFVSVVPVVLGLAAVLALIKKLDDNIKPLKGKRIAVLGMQGAGKTQFLANIRNIEHNGSTMGIEPFDPFEIKIGNREVLIEKGEDMSGNVNYIKDNYIRLINDNEIIFFLFNGFDYINNEDYRDNTQARLDFIHRHRGDKEIVIFATFKDKFQDEKTPYLGILESLKEKDYRSLITGENFFVLDMRDKDFLINKILNKLFS